MDCLVWEGAFPTCTLQRVEESLDGLRNDFYICSEGFGAEEKRWWRRASQVLGWGMEVKGGWWWGEWWAVGSE